jgi:predicted peroxiredoxin
MKIVLTDIIRKKQSLYFLYKLFVFVLIIFTLDYTIGSILKYYYFTQSSGFYYRTTYSLEKTKADVLIFGSSKANHQFYPDAFEKRLKLSYYNVGRDGSSIFYHYAMLKSVLQRYTPKIIILEVTREFEKKQFSYDRISMLLPYYDRHPEIRSIIELKSPFEKLKLTSKVYPYNSLVFSIISGNSEFNTHKNKDSKGYVPLTNVWKEPIQYFWAPSGKEVDTAKINIYESFIKDCIKSGVKLYVVCSPNFYKLDHIDNSYLIGKEMAQKYNIKFIDHSKDSLFINNNCYFADIHHLNKNGSILFTNILVDEIIKDYQSKEPN